MIIDVNHFSNNNGVFVAFRGDLPFSGREDSDMLFVKANDERIRFDRINADTYVSNDPRVERLQVRIINQ